MISAKEAREQAEAIREDKAEQAMDHINFAISEAASRGEFSTQVHVEHNLVMDVRSQLFALGYQVEPKKDFGQFESGFTVTISWEEPAS